LDRSDFYKYSIGSGYPFSEFFFDQEHYDYECSLEEGLYFAFRAKKAAEPHVGVGKATDLFIINKGEKPIIITTKSDKIKLLDSYYTIDKENSQKFRNGLYGKIKEEIIK